MTFTYVARREVHPLTREVRLVLIGDDQTVQLVAGDELFTVTTKVPMIDRNGQALA